MKAVKQPRKRTPDVAADGWINKATVCQSLGITPPGFDRWHVKPAGKIGREVFYTLAAIVAAREARMHRKYANKKQPDPAIVVAEAEKTMLVREQRIAQEMKNAKTRKELAPISLIEYALASAGNQLTAILDSIPPKVKQLLPKMTAAEVAIIEREITKARNVAAEIDVDWDEYDRQHAGKQDQN